MRVLQQIVREAETHDAFDTRVQAVQHAMINHPQRVLIVKHGCDLAADAHWRAVLHACDTVDALERAPDARHQRALLCQLDAKYDVIAFHESACTLYTRDLRATLACAERLLNVSGMLVFEHYTRTGVCGMSPLLSGTSPLSGTSLLRSTLARAIHAHAHARHVAALAHLRCDSRCVRESVIERRRVKKIRSYVFTKRRVYEYFA